MVTAIRIGGNLDKLVTGLGDLKQETKTRILASASREAIRGASVVAKKDVIARGNYGAAGLAGRVRQSISWKHVGGGTGEIKAQDRTYSLARSGWAGRAATGNYTSEVRGGFRHLVRGGKGKKPRMGVRLDHVVQRDWYAKGSGKAFVRAGASGNVHVFMRTGPDRKSLVALQSMSPAHVLHHHVVFDAIEAKYHQRVQERYFSKYEYALARIKGKYGL